MTRPHSLFGYVPMVLIRVAAGAGIGLAASVLFLLVGVVRFLIVLPALLSREVENTAGNQLFEIARFVGGYALALAGAGAVAGLLSPLARWTVGLFIAGICAGIVGMAGIAALAGDWVGLQTFADFGVWGLGTIFGIAGSWGIRGARKDDKGLNVWSRRA